MQQFAQQTFTQPTLAQPSEAEQKKSIQLIEHLIALMADDPSGSISFAHYMDEVLYHPQWGYYSSGQVRFGKTGDFITAPERSPLFAAGICSEWQQAYDPANPADFIEYGAGSGQLMIDLLTQMADTDCLPRRYFIIERAAALRERQQQRLDTQLPAEIAQRVCFAEDLDAIDWQGGMIVANEVLDAFACERLRWLPGRPESAEQMRVGFNGQRFIWRSQSADQKIQAQLATLTPRLAGYRTTSEPVYCELNRQIQPFLTELAKQLKAAGQPTELLLFDYGGRTADLYHPQRADGTLRCHFRHLAHDDPFVYPGLQDITAWVDFEQVEEQAQSAGFDACGFVTQGQWLLNTNVPDQLAQTMQNTTDPAEQIKLAQQLRDLVMPAEMGERFQLLALRFNP